jgi:hypothetical protein
MAFRDETEALRHRRGLLQSENEELDAERARLVAELESEAQDVERSVKLRVGGSIGLLLFISLVLPTVAVAVLFLGGGAGAGAETIFGSIDATTGNPPVREGAPCTVFISDYASDDSSYSARMEVVCDGRTIYGGSGSGLLDCTWGHVYATHCVDPDFTSDGGDPKLTFDRDEGEVIIEDQRPRWGVRVRLPYVRTDR